MASCHSITYVKDKIVGDPLDVKMFQSTKWILEEPNTNNKIDDFILAKIQHPYKLSEK